MAISEKRSMGIIHYLAIHLPIYFQVTTHKNQFNKLHVIQQILLILKYISFNKQIITHKPNRESECISNLRCQTASTILHLLSHWLTITHEWISHQNKILPNRNNTYHQRIQSHLKHSYHHWGVHHLTCLPNAQPLFNRA